MPAAPEYWLECPECGAKRRLRSNEPGARVRCRHCHAVSEVPGKVDGGASALRLPPERRSKLLKAFSIPRLLAFAAVSLMAGGALIVAVWARASSVLEQESRLGPAAIPSWNGEVEPWPLEVGVEWTFRCGDRRERWRLTERESQRYGALCRVERETAAGTEAWLYEDREAGVYLARIERADGIEPFDPPVRVLARPVQVGDVWSSEGREYRVGEATLTTVVGTRASLVVEERSPSGMERVAYILGVGPARIDRGEGEAVERWELAAFDYRP